MKHRYTVEQVQDAVNKSESIAQVLDKHALTVIYHNG